MDHRHPRKFRWFLALAVLTLMVGASMAADLDADRLGTVQGDTLLVDLDRLVSLALEHNEQLQAGRAATDAARAQTTGAWSGFLPQLKVSKGFMRTDDALGAFGFKLHTRSVTAADFDPARLNTPGESNLWTTRLQLLQPVFNGGMAWSGKSAANASVRAAEQDQTRAEDTVVLQCVQAYEGLALALAYTDVVQAAITSAEAHERQAQSLLDAEMATEADLLQARVFLSGLRQQLITVTNQVAQAGEMIRLLTTVETPLVLAVGPGVRLAAAAEAPRSAEVAARADLLAHEARADAASAMVGVARGAMLPHLNLGLNRDWMSRDEVFGSEADSWSLGVVATWEFKGLANVAKLKQARAQRRAASHLSDFQKRQARHEAQQAWRNAHAAASRVDVAAGAVDAARESLRIVTNQYREGLADMVDLLDVQAAAIQAEGDLVQARHDQQVELARLAYAAGRRIHPGGNQ